MRDHSVIYLASDGSEEQTVGAFAIALSPGGYACATGNGDEDQTPFKQELLGFCAAASAFAAAAASCPWTGRAVFVLDCMSALNARHPGTREKYPALAANIRGALRAISDCGAQISYVWVPSHGKRPSWEAPLGMCTESLRLLNKKADRAAADCRNRRLLGSAREAWVQQRRAAEDWEFRAIMASSAAAAQYHAFLRQHGTRARERPAAPFEEAPADAQADPN